MQEQTEAPQLTLIGHAEDVVLGILGGSGDLGMEAEQDFEFEQDSL